MQQIRMSFNELHKGAIFTSNGNEYVKKTNRTAYLIKHNRAFYFKQNELVLFTGKYSSLYDGRYTIKKEYNGSASLAYVIRFCGEYIGSSSSKKEGEKLADCHLNKRNKIIEKMKKKLYKCKL